MSHPGLSSEGLASAQASIGNWRNLVGTAAPLRMATREGRIKNYELRIGEGFDRMPVREPRRWLCRAIERVPRPGGGVSMIPGNRFGTVTRWGPGRDLAQRGGGAEKMDSGSPRLSLSAR